ncbi:hypothetical protein REB14_15820 [Chryseobacterium sp. ES2]|uniref:Uncharacterized protein n=1 Tax=Chryseobacterium metallicongregator TaxID=3073042 RepID=A0ABU1E7D2_9FLAO|nr:hypothetical protein [Chryseobacterium sp. ES2]MDR4953646.1 hypothetical protein [Chryseobacterium sp. ES2]
MDRNLLLQDLDQKEDVIWNHYLPISLDFVEGSRLALENQISSLENKEALYYRYYK